MALPVYYFWLNLNDYKKEFEEINILVQESVKQAVLCIHFVFTPYVNSGLNFIYICTKVCVWGGVLY